MVAKRYKINPTTKKLEQANIEEYMAERNMEKQEQLYAIRDKKAGINSVYVFATHGIAIRWFDELVKNEQSSLNKYPDDFELLHIGKMNNQTGTITNTLTILAKGTDHVKKNSRK
jgi:hypothetical protein